MLHYPFLPDVASMCSSLFTNYRCFDSLYRQNGLTHDKTKFPDRKFPGFPVLVNQASLQMATSKMTHCQYFHVIFHVSRLILTADTTTVHGIAKPITGFILKCVIVKNGDHFNDNST